MQNEGAYSNIKIHKQVRSLILHHLQEVLVGYQARDESGSVMLSRCLHARNHLRLVSMYASLTRELPGPSLDYNNDHTKIAYRHIINLSGKSIIGYSDLLEYSGSADTAALQNEKLYRVLIVGHNISFIQPLISSLEQAGFEIYVAIDYSQAIQKAKNIRIDLFIMDVSLPGIGGFEASAKLRGRFAVPVILTGTKSDDNTWEKAVKAGADHYEILPCNYSGLAARARIILHQRNTDN